MQVACVRKRHRTPLREGDQLSVAGAVDGLKVFDDPFGVLLAEGRFASERVLDGFVGREIADVTVQ